MKRYKALLAAVMVLVAASCGPDFVPNDTAPGPDFTALFNDTDFTGWNIEPDEGAWVVEDGAIVCKGTPKLPYLITTDREYENFEFYAEFNAAEDCNSGIFFHAPLTGRQSRLGFEVQIDYNQPPDSKNATGAIYDVVPPLAAPVRGEGKWNQYRVVLDWPQCTVWLNGVLVQDTNFEEHPELRHRLRRGPIGLSNHGSGIVYRNLWVRELPDTDSDAVAFNGEDLTGWSMVGDADWHVEDGMIVSTTGEGYLVSDREYENVYFHAYASNDTLAHMEARFHHRFRDADDPGYAVDFLDYPDAVRFIEQYGDKVPSDIIRPIGTPWLMYRIVSGDRESIAWLNEFPIEDRKLLGKAPGGRIAIYRGAGDGLIRLKGIKIRKLTGPGI
jgi:hypothetical protein